MEAAELEEPTRAAVAAAIESSGRTDPELARALGINKGSIANYRAGNNTIPLDKALALAHHLRITISQLVGDVPLPDRPPELQELARLIRLSADSQTESAKLLRDVAERVGTLAAPARGKTGTG